MNPLPGEEASLAERRTVMQQSEKVARELNEALDAVGGPHSAVPHLSAALRKLERRASLLPALVEPCVNALDAALVALDEARAAIENAVAESEFDPRELERVEERLFALRAAARKYNVAADDLADLAGRFASDVAAIDAGEAELAVLAAAQDKAEAAYAAAAEALSAGRKKAARKLDVAVQAELPPLKLERARFITEIVTDPASRDAAGIDRVEFWAQTNPAPSPDR